MRVLITSDLHFDHGKSRQLAEKAADDINALSFDVLLVVGDTATSRGTALEAGLARFIHRGPKLLTLGNHELWSPPPPSEASQDPAAARCSLHLYTQTLPARVAAAGWHCLDAAPYLATPDLAFVGSVGWYDYSFAPDYLGVPRRFYEAKIAPGSASYYASFARLFDRTDDIAPAAMEIFARWNDGRFVRWPDALGGDEGFTDFLLRRLEAQLETMRGVGRVIAGVHHLPLRELLPPPATQAWDFAKAYLGSGRFGELLQRYPNVSHVFSGHSHFPADTTVGHIHYAATGSGYRQKLWQIVEL